MFRSRTAALGAIFGLLFCVVTLRLAWVQLVRADHYDRLAIRTRIGKETLLARRGRILDRHGVPLAFDVPGFNLSVRIGYTLRNTTLGALCQLSSFFPPGGEESRIGPRFCQPDRWILSLKVSDLEAIPSQPRRDDAFSKLRRLLRVVSGKEMRLDARRTTTAQETLGEYLGPVRSEELVDRISENDGENGLWSIAVPLLLAVDRPWIELVARDPAPWIDRVLEISGAQVAEISDRYLRLECRTLFSSLLHTERKSVDARVRDDFEKSLATAVAGGSQEAKRTILRGLSKDFAHLEEIASELQMELSAVLAELDAVWLKADARVRSAVGRYLREENDDVTDRQLSNAWADRFRDYPLRRQRLFTGIPYDAVLTVFEFDIPGFEIAERSHREVRSAHDLHIAGWTGLVTEEELSEYRARIAGFESMVVDGGLPLEAKQEFDRLERSGLRRDEVLGRSGLEGKLDDTLRGRHGYQKLLRDRRGRTVEVVEEQRPVPGLDLTLTIETRYQEIAIEALRGRPGAVVMLEVGSGHVLCLVSSPGFELESFRANFSDLSSDPRHPLINRACRIPIGYFPGSTFKIVLAVAGLEEKVITTESTFVCGGSLRPGRQHSFKCLGVHGEVALTRAIAKSCNVFFYRLGEALGSDRIAKWGRKLGFGQPTGIELREDRGFLNSISTSRRGWSIGDTWHLSIGQKEIAVTPIQVAQMMSVIAQDGVLIPPTLIAAVGGKTAVPREHIDVGISSEILRIIQVALAEVVSVGTAEGTGLDEFRAAAKTGTAQVGGVEPDETWFVGYAPRERPRVVVCVFLERADGSTAETVVPIGRTMFEAYFGEREDGL